MSQCTAKAKITGKQCARQAIAGGNVCRVHGGAAPHVKAAAEARLRAMVNPALGVLEYAMGKKASKLKEAISAAKEVLDRAEFGETEGGGNLGAKHKIELVFVKAPKGEDA